MDQTANDPAKENVDQTDKKTEPAPKKKRDRRAWREAYMAANKDKINAKRRHRYATDAEFRERVTKSDAVWNSRLKYIYGITLQDYRDMEAEQDWRCGMCGRKPKGKLCVDHDHTTRDVRGLLCPNCNLAAGLLRHDANIFRAGERWMEKPPRIRGSATVKARGCATRRRGAGQPRS
jgi:recombination endonuclease VII